MTNRVCSLIVLCFLWGSTQRAQGITCGHVRKISDRTLELHISQQKFNEDLAKKALDNYIKAWDPGKLYFLKSDIEKFQKQYVPTLFKDIKQVRCHNVDDVVRVYMKRFEERQADIDKLIQRKFDFTLDEYMVIDRDVVTWAEDSKELKDRWRKRVKYQYRQLKEALSDDKKIREKLAKRFQLLRKRTSELSTDDTYSTLLNAIATALDPHSSYYSREQLDNFRINTRLSLEGIGAVLHSDDGLTTVSSIVKGGAAARQGQLKVGDKIVAVAQGAKGEPVDVIDMYLPDVVKLIRGPGGSTVLLHIRRDEGRKKNHQIAIVREKIVLADRAASSKVYDTKVGEETYKIGLISLPSFYIDFEGRQARQENFRSSSRDVWKEMMSLSEQKIDGMIVDLRSNGGGSLDEAINIAGLFVDKAPVVQIKGGQEEKPHVSYDQDGGKSFYDGPLLVMVDRQSASASEIFAGAIKDYERGLIVGGDHTFGKGTVQNLHDLENDMGALKVTIRRFYRPSGDSTQLRGVESDIVLPSMANELEIGEEHYKHALEWDVTTPAQYPNYHKVTPYVAELKKVSSHRVDQDENFAEIREAILEFRKDKEARTKVSLKEEKNTDSHSEKDNKEAEQPTDEVVESLPDDPYLQESLRIATDYIRVLKKKKVDIVEVPLLKKLKAEQLAKGKDKKL
ncbi:MAG: carboxy terminal-processing peptidase [Oligoflexales bacterium]